MDARCLGLRGFLFFQPGGTQLAKGDNAAGEIKNQNVMSIANSNNEPGVSPLRTGIKVGFVAIPPLQLQIKNSNFMKTPPSNQINAVAPSVFQIAAHLEDFVPAAGLKKSVPELRQTLLAGFVLNRKKYEAESKTATVKPDASAPPHPTRHNGDNGVGRGLAAKSRGRNGSGKPAAQSANGKSKSIEFLLEAPSASSVKLAADFTNWEASPIDMMQYKEGVWFRIIPLSPGQYSYRFIVDGQWCDDPRCPQRVPNPFGTANNVLVVT